MLLWGKTTIVWFLYKPLDLTSIYKHKPLFYEARPSCTGYKARIAFVIDHAFWKYLYTNNCKHRS